MTTPTREQLIELAKECGFGKASVAFADELEAFAARLASHPSAVPEPTEGIQANDFHANPVRIEMANWICERWHAEVANRPLVNVHRRTLDDTWRQMLRHLCIDDRVRLGPTHDELLSSKDSQ